MRPLSVRAPTSVNSIPICSPMVPLPRGMISWIVISFVFKIVHIAYATQNKIGAYPFTTFYSQPIIQYHIHRIIIVENFLDPFGTLFFTEHGGFIDIAANTDDQF